MGTTDFTTSDSGISASVTSPIADTNDGATGLGSIITVAANTTSLTGTGRVKAIKTDMEINAAADGKQFKIVNGEPILYASSLTATSVADTVTSLISDSTYLVTEGSFAYNGTTYTAGQSFVGTLGSSATISGSGTTAIAAGTSYKVTANSVTYNDEVYASGTSFVGVSGVATVTNTNLSNDSTIKPHKTATASGASALAVVTASTISTGGALTNGQIGNSANAADTVAVVTGQSYLITAGTMTYNSTDYAAGSTFTAVSGVGTAAAKGGTLSIFTTGSDFNAGEVIEKASGVYIGVATKAITYVSPAAAAQQIVAKLQAEGIIGLNLTDNIDGTFDIVLGGNLSVASATVSYKAINSIDLTMQMVSADRAMFGALSNRFDLSISNLSNVAANSEMSLGRLQDADFAAETSRLTTSRILEQASIAMMAQANAAKQNVLQLLG